MIKHKTSNKSVDKPVQQNQHVMFFFA